MSSITKYFFSFFILLFVSFGVIIIDALSVDEQKQGAIKSFSAISTLPDSILSTSQFESRYRAFRDARYGFSDTKYDINYMDFSRR